MRILVIDDDDEILAMICKMLDCAGFDVLTAVNGKEGMRMIRSEPDFDLVVTDLIMPEKEGMETIGELKADFPDIKIVAISGGGKAIADNYLSLARALGADLTLSKPFVKQELLGAIQQLSA